MALNFDERNLLPEGIHDATLSEVEEHFSYGSSRRRMLFGKLSEYLRDLKLTGWTCTVLLDGSFVMPSVKEPDDIDIILVVQADWQPPVELRPFELNLVSSRDAKREFKVEAKLVRAGSKEEQEYLTLFQQVNIKWCQLFGLPPESRKGIVRIIP